MALEFRTSGLAANERFDYWRHVVSDTFVPLRVDPVDERGFHGKLRSEQFGELQASEVAATAHKVVRTSRLIGRSDGDYYKVALQLRGTCLLAQDGHEVPLGAGDLAIYDTTRPYMLSFEHHQ